MRKTRFAEHQIVKILKAVRGGRGSANVCRDNVISPAPTITGNQSMAEWKHQI